MDRRIVLDTRPQEDKFGSGIDSSYGLGGHANRSLGSTLRLKRWFNENQIIRAGCRDVAVGSTFTCSFRNWTWPNVRSLYHSRLKRGIAIGYDLPRNTDRSNGR